MPKLDKKGGYVAPDVQVGGETVVFDKARNVKVMTLRGVVVLPAGARVVLMDPNVEATVIGVRLLAAVDDSPATVCLDV